MNKERADLVDNALNVYIGALNRAASATTKLRSHVGAPLEPWSGQLGLSLLDEVRDSGIAVGYAWVDFMKMAEREAGSGL